MAHVRAAPAPSVAQNKLEHPCKRTLLDRRPFPDRLAFRASLQTKGKPAEGSHCSRNRMQEWRGTFSVHARAFAHLIRSLCDLCTQRHVVIVEDCDEEVDADEHHAELDGPTHRSISAFARWANSSARPIWV